MPPPRENAGDPADGCSRREDRRTAFLLLRSRLVCEAVGKLLEGTGLAVIGSASDVTAAESGEAIPEPARRANFVIVDSGYCTAHPGIVQQIRLAAAGRIVILAEHDDFPRLGLAQVMAADGVLTLQISSAALIHALDLVGAGERVVPADLVAHLAAAPQRDEAAETAGGRTLSPREIDILHYLVSGASNKMIAHELGITESTVKVHLKALTRKLGVANRTQAALWARNNGLSDDRIVRALRRVRDAEICVARQRALVANLERSGDAEAARRAREALATLQISLDLAREHLALARVTPAS